MIFHKIHIFLKYQSLGNFRIKSLILPQREQQKNYVQWIRHIFYILECKWEKVNCRAWASSIKEIHKEEEWNGTTTLESVKSRDMGLYLSSSFFLLSLLSAEDLNSAPLVWPPVKIIMHSANVLQMGRRLDLGPLLRYTNSQQQQMCKTSLNIGGIYNIKRTFLFFRCAHTSCLHG